MSEEKLTTRRPVVADFELALKDLATMRALAPLVLASLASLILSIFTTLNPLLGLIVVTMTSYVHAVWTRMLTPAEPTLVTPPPESTL